MSFYANLPKREEVGLRVDFTKDRKLFLHDRETHDPDRSSD